MKVTFRDIENYYYNATVSKIKEDSGHYGAFLRMSFTILDGDLENYNFSGSVKPSPIKKSKFYRWVTNILGKEPPEEFYTEDLIDKLCVITLSRRGRLYFVSDVFPINGVLSNSLTSLY